MTDGVTRKAQHLDIVLKRDVAAHAVSTGFEAIRFEHAALPEMALADVDRTRIGKKSYWQNKGVPRLFLGPVVPPRRV